MTQNAVCLRAQSPCPWEDRLSMVLGGLVALPPRPAGASRQISVTLPPQPLVRVHSSSGCLGGDGIHLPSPLPQQALPMTLAAPPLQPQPAAELGSSGDACAAAALVATPSGSPALRPHYGEALDADRDRVVVGCSSQGPQQQQQQQPACSDQSNVRGGWAEGGAVAHRAATVQEVESTTSGLSDVADGLAATLGRFKTA